MALTPIEQEAVEGIVDRGIMPIINAEKLRVVEAIARAVGKLAALHGTEGVVSPGLEYVGVMVLEPLIEELRTAVDAGDKP